MLSRMATEMVASMGVAANSGVHIPISVAVSEVAVIGVAVVRVALMTIILVVNIVAV